MRCAFALAWLALASPSNSDIDSGGCRKPNCATSVQFASTSEDRSYGLLVAAPDGGCRHVRFRIHDDHARLLGQSPPLAPGELALVRLGRGFPQGSNLVTVASIGCDQPPAAIRRVILAKAGPDHGWRAEGF